MRILTAIAFTLCSVFAAAQEIPSLRVGAEELADYLAVSTDSVAAIMVKEVLAGKVQAYFDPDFNTLVPAKEVQKWKLHLVRHEFKVPDPHDQNNLKDTVIEEEKFIPEYRYVIMDKERLRFFFNPQKQFYVKRADLENSVNTRFLEAYSKTMGDTMRKDYNDLDAADVSKRFAAAIHEQVLKGKIKAYRDNGLRSMIPLADLQKLPETTYHPDSAGYFQAYFREETIGRQSKFRCNALAQCSKAGAKPLPAYYISRYEIESALAPEFSQLLLGAVNFTADNAARK